MPVVKSGAPAIEGGTPVRDTCARPWPVWPVFDRAEESALLDVLRSGKWWYVEGAEGQAFEKEFAAYQDARHGVACTNGSAALEISLRALGAGCGDEVIIPAYTFVATATAVLSVGATPVFVDIDGDTLNLNPALIEPAITTRTRGLIPVHVAGRPADMDAILEVARKHNLFVIEDAAQAHGAAWRGTRVGAHGDLGTFSFQASKNLTGGEGGMIVSRDDRLADAAWSVMNVGRTRSGKWYEHHVLGSNFRMTEFQAAVLRAQLRRLPEQSARRTANAQYLRGLLEGISGVRLPAPDTRVTEHAYHLFTFRYEADCFGGRTCDDFIAALNAEGVPCFRGYVPLHKEPLFERLARGRQRRCGGGRHIDYPSLDLPVTEAACNDSVWIFQTVLLGDRSDMDDIAEAVCKVQAAWST